jgi:hypothetical protein
VPGRDDYPLELRVSYALYLILIQLPETSSVFNCGELNTFVMGDDRLCGDVLPAPSGFTAVQFTADNNSLSRSLSLSDDTYTRMYGSMWVSIPPSASGGEMVIGLYITGDSGSETGFRLAIGDEFTSNIYHEFTINPATTTTREAIKYPTSNPTNERWMHILWELDTTEAVLANRLKVYIGDVRRAVFEDLNITQNATINLGAGPHVAYFEATDPVAFGVNDATAKIAAGWVKFATSNLFDFDNATDRRNFISASLQYVPHAATMGGQAADFWGAGNLTGWTGWTNSGGTSVSEPGTLTSVG